MVAPIERKEKMSRKRKYEETMTMHSLRLPLGLYAKVQQEAARETLSRRQKWQVLLSCRDGRHELDLGNSLRGGSLGIHEENRDSDCEAGLNGEVLPAES